MAGLQADGLITRVGAHAKHAALVRVRQMIKQAKMWELQTDLQIDEMADGLGDMFADATFMDE